MTHLLFSRGNEIYSWIISLYLSLFATCWIPSLAAHATEIQKDFATYEIEWDSQGYVFFCLCMGRFGNQVEHLLGGMSFAKALNRTLVVPPFITHKTVPFDQWFRFDELRKYHKSILADDFMSHLASKHWPPSRRKGYCWLPVGSKNQCNMTTGSPFKIFWGDQNITFVEDISHHLDFDVDDHYAKAEWMKRFPAKDHPVLSMRGAPARYPMKPGHRYLQQYLVWTPWIKETAEHFIADKMKGERFIGIHLRNEPSWTRDCSLAVGQASFMASPQCITAGKYGLIKMDLCSPTREQIIAQTRAVLQNNNAKHLFIATDNDPMLKDFRSAFHSDGVSLHYLNPERPQIDLAVLGLADHFIGNCISSFTGFVKRERDIKGLPSSFWSFP